jgi:CRISPR-associated protein Csd1
VGVLHVAKDGKLLKTWNGPTDTTPEIFDATKKVGGSAEAFIRWSVEIPDDPQSDLWSDTTVWKSWMDYYASTKKIRKLCYVTGEESLIADQHPRKIRNDGDGAKLISSNDEGGFTFRGRFTDATEACSIGYEVTQKAHNALRWLIARQGYRDDSQAIVAWAPSGSAIPMPLCSTQDLLSIEMDSVNPSQTGYTAQEIGIQLSKRIAGYSVQLGNTDDIVVMALDSATPGRIAIRFYRELTGSAYLQRINMWHDPDTGCTWHRSLVKDKKTIVFIGAPAPRDIAEATYGKRLDDKLRISTVERLLP